METAWFLTKYYYFKARQWLLATCCSCPRSAPKVELKEVLLTDIERKTTVLSPEAANFIVDCPKRKIRFSRLYEDPRPSVIAARLRLRDANTGEERLKLVYPWTRPISLEELYSGPV